MSEHTKGPWVVELNGWSSGNGHHGGSIGALDSKRGTYTRDSNGNVEFHPHSRTIIHYTLSGNGLPVDENRANAHLIASAPDLLAALEDLLGQCEHGAAYHGITIDSPSAKQAITAARTALSKARGRS